MREQKYRRLVLAAEASKVGDTDTREGAIEDSCSKYPDLFDWVVINHYPRVTHTLFPEIVLLVRYHSTLALKRYARSSEVILGGNFVNYYSVEQKCRVTSRPTTQNDFFAVNNNRTLRVTKEREAIKKISTPK